MKKQGLTYKAELYIKIANWRCSLAILGKTKKMVYAFTFASNVYKGKWKRNE